MSKSQEETQSQTWTSAVYRRDVDWEMTLLLRRVLGKKRRERFFKEVNEYRERVIKNQRQKDLQAISYHFAIPVKDLEKVLGKEDE